MRKSSLVIVMLLAGLQYSLWFAEGGLLTVFQMKKKVSLQQEENKRLASENEGLAAEVADLKSGVAAIEERARNELGFIKQDETYFLVVPERAQAYKKT